MSDNQPFSPLTPALGVVLRKLRIERGWSQAQLASKLRMHVKTLATYEQGVRNMTLPVLWEICKKLRANMARVVAMAEALAKVGPPACPTCEGTGVKSRTRNRRQTTDSAGTG